MRTETRGKRLAATPLVDLGEIDPEVGRLYLDALDRLRSVGVVVEMAQPPLALEASFKPNGMLMAGEGWRLWRDWIKQHAEIMDPWIVGRFEVGRDVSDERLADIHLQRHAAQAEFHAWLADYDGLVSPTCPIPAPPVDNIDETTSPLSRLTRAANYLDLPGISVPCGLTAAGLPAGLQILGRPRDEATPVALAAAFERISGWNGRAPDLSGFG